METDLFVRNGDVASEKQRIADLLEELNLKVFWLYIFDRAILNVKDHQGIIRWSRQSINMDYLRTELLHFLEDEKRKEDTPPTHS